MRLLVLGNGFDLALGYPTSYDDFANAELISPVQELDFTCNFWPFKEPDNGPYRDHSLHSHMYNYAIKHTDRDGRIRWVDIEMQLYSYARTKIGSTIDPGLVQEDKESFQKLRRYLNRWISRAFNGEWKNDRECTTIRDFIKAITDNNGCSIIWSFNYTNTREELSTFGEYNNPMYPRIYNIHGTCTNSSNPNIIVGIHEDLQIPHEYQFLFKSNYTTNHISFLQDLTTANEVIIYGHSIGITDSDYFSPYFGFIKNIRIPDKSKRFTIITKGVNAVEQILSNIREHIKISTLKSQIDFSIIDISKVCEPGIDLDLYTNLLKRLRNG